MELQELATKLKEILGTNDRGVYDSPDEYWSFYTAIHGHYGDEYYCISINQYKQDKTIEINPTTDNPEIFLAIIKGIDPTAKVTYTNLVKEVVTE